MLIRILLVVGGWLVVLALSMGIGAWLRRAGRHYPPPDGDDRK